MFHVFLVLPNGLFRRSFRAYMGRGSSEFFQVPEPVWECQIQYIDIFLHIPAYFWHISSYFSEIPSYFPHISSYFPHIPSFIFHIFIHFSYIVIPPSPRLAHRWGDEWRKFTNIQNQIWVWKRLDSRIRLFDNVRLQCYQRKTTKRQVKQNII